jgi:methylamine dehydrogenase accessory protein MauD
MSEFWAASLVVLWLLVLFMAFLLLGALRQLGLLQLRLGSDPGALVTRSGLDRGTIAPDFTAEPVGGGPATTLSALSAQPRVLVFLSTSCYACKEFLPHIKEVARTRSGWEFVVLCRGDRPSCQAFLKGSDVLAPILLDLDGLISASYEVALTPFVYVLDYERRVLIRGVATNWVQLDGMLDQEGTIQQGTMTVQEAALGGSQESRTTEGNPR